MAGLTADERAALLDSLRRLLADRCAESDVRRIMASETGHDAALWRALADLGVVGLTVPEQHGGAGLGAIELELVMEAAGAALLATAWGARRLFARLNAPAGEAA